MAEISPDTIARWIALDVVEPTFRTLFQTALDVLSMRLEGLSEERRAETVERLIARLVAPLERIRQESLDDGFEPRFELSLDEDTAYIRAVGGESHDFLERLRGVTSDVFEEFCVRVLVGLGGRGTVLGQTGDGGVDFAARDINLCTPATIGARIFVIGQAKRYSVTNLVSETQLREFVGGALRRLHNHEDSVTFRPGILSPIIFAFWTTSDFQPSARRWARAMGLWYLNGVGVSQLAMRLGVSL